MHEYYDKSMRALRLAGLSPSTQKAYTRSVRLLVEFYDKSPQAISEAEVEDYFLHRIDETGWSPSTLRICYSGVKFYFVHILERDWKVFDYLKARHEKRLPSVLSREEVRLILARVVTFHNYVFLVTVYSCGLRLSEALALEVGDVDSAQMHLHVHRGKGAKDRSVPLPDETLGLLRRYWRTHRNPKLLFPARGRGGNKAPTATEPMAIDSVQGAFRRARFDAGITKRRVSIHTLRHAYATHLLEAGVHVRAIQRYLGHGQLETTMVYFHLTPKGSEDAFRRINTTMRALDQLAPCTAGVA